MKKIITVSMTCMLLNVVSAQYLPTTGGTLSGILTLTSPGNAIQVIGQQAAPAYMLFDQQTSNYGGKMWRLGHTGFASGFSSFDIANISDNIAALSIAANGNLGIGKTEPLFKMDVYDASGTGTVANWNSNNAAFGFRFNTSAAYMGTKNFAVNNGSNDKDFGISSGSGGNLLLGVGAGIETMRLTASGNVGIGTTDPIAKFDVAGNSNFGGSVSMNDNFIYLTRGGESISGIGGSGAMSIFSRGALTINGNANNINTAIIFQNNGATSMSIVPGGNVGIGTGTPSEKLSVNGNIKARKLIVTPNGWSDYVFHSSYKLQPLSDVEQFIKQNRRLPDIPSEKEVKEKGISVGDNQALLLKKIEELTLYIIDLQKQVNVQGNEIKSLKNKKHRS